jgi:vesicle-fusing ATPase
MAKEFLMQFSGLALTVGQPLVFSFMDKKLLGLNVKGIEAIDASSIRENKSAEPRKISFGRLTGNAVIQFEKAENSALNLVGKAKGYVRQY